MERVSAIIPARNEAANIERCVRSLAAQPEIAEIIVVDDQSTDGTGDILWRLSLELKHLRVLKVDALPKGWTGKNHAVWMGAQQAQQAWLLFTDADTEHLPGSTRRALNDAERHDVELVSYSPDQEMPTWWERALIPFVYCRLSQLFPYSSFYLPNLPPAANGQYILVRRHAYFAAGGHQAIAGEIVEDVALALQMRMAGSKIYFARAEGIARTRMYRTFGQMWEGWRKNLHPLVRIYSGWFSETASILLPLLLIFFISKGAHPSPLSWSDSLLLGLAGLLTLHGAYGLRLHRNRYPLSSILYYLPAVALYSAALVASAAAHRRGRVTWKGREYPVGTK